MTRMLRGYFPLSKGCPFPWSRVASSGSLSFVSFLFLVFLPFPSCAPPEKPSQEEERCAPRIEVQEGRIVVAGKSLLLRGINFSGVLKDPPFTEGVTSADLFFVRSLGMNAVRFLIFYRAVEPEPGQFSEPYLRWLDTMLEAAQRAGVWVLLDMHQDLYGGPFLPHGNPTWSCPESEGKGQLYLTPWFLNYLNPWVGECFARFFTDPERIRAFTTMWEVVAERYRYHPQVLGFELLNEPFPGALPPLKFDEQILRDWTNQVGQALERRAPCKAIAFEPMALGSSIGLPSRMLPVTLRKPLYAPHLYLVETESGEPYRERGSGYFKELLALKKSEGLRHQAATLIGEWGNILEWGDRDPRLAETLVRDFYEAADLLLLSTFYWNYGSRGGRGLFTSEGALRPFVGAFIRPTLSAYTGEIKELHWEGGELMLTFTWVTQGQGELEIVLPKGWEVGAIDPPLPYALEENTLFLRTEAQGYPQGRRIALKFRTGSP